MVAQKKITTRKIIFLLIGLLALGVVALFIYLTDKISPEKIKSMVITELEMALPQAQVELGQLDYGVFPSLSFRVDNFTLREKGSKGPDLFSVGGVDVRIPLLDFLLGEGKAEVTVSGPRIFYHETKGEGPNWGRILGNQIGRERPSKKSATKKDKALNGDSSKGTPLWSFLEKSRVNVKLLNLALNYKIPGQDGNLAISRLLVKGLNLQSPTAFELDSDLIFKDQLSLHLMAIGQVSLNEWAKKGSLPASVLLKAKNIQSPLFGPKQLPELKLEIKTELKAMKDPFVGVKGELAGLGKWQADLQWNPLGVSAKNIKTEIIVTKLLSLVPLDNPFLKTLRKESSPSKFLLSGDYGVKKGRHNPQIQFSFDRPLVTAAFKKNLIDSLKIGLEGSLQGENLSLRLENHFWDGELDLDVKSRFDLGRLPTGPGDMAIIEVQSLLSGINIPLKKMGAMLYKKNPEKKNSLKGGAVSTPDVPKELGSLTKKASTPLPLPPIKFSLKAQQVGLGEKKMNLKLDLKTLNNRVAVKKLNWTWGRSLGLGKFYAEYKKGAWAGSIGLDVKNLELKYLTPLLPPILAGAQGDLQADLGGSFSFPGKGPDLFDHDIKVDMLLKKVVLRELIWALSWKKAFPFSPLWPKKIKDKVPKIGPEIDSLSIKARLRQNHYRLYHLKLLGPSGVYRLGGGGHLYPGVHPRKGQLDFDYDERDPDRLSILQRYLGKGPLPFRLEGPGLALGVNYGYTAKVLGKRVAKKESSKLKKKLSNKIKEKAKSEMNESVNKLLKNEKIGKEVNKMFKGFFK